MVKKLSHINVFNKKEEEQLLPNPKTVITRLLQFMLLQKRLNAT